LNLKTFNHAHISFYASFICVGMSRRGGCPSGASAAVFLLGAIERIFHLWCVFVRAVVKSTDCVLLPNPASSSLLLVLQANLCVHSCCQFLDGLCGASGSSQSARSCLNRKLKWRFVTSAQHNCVQSLSTHTARCDC
jgi:hypothetical protein